jgi:hypothetical protein
LQASSSNIRGWVCREQGCVWGGCICWRGHLLVDWLLFDDDHIYDRSTQCMGGGAADGEAQWNRQQELREVPELVGRV